MKDDTISRAAALDVLEKIDCSDGVGISSLKCDAVDDAVTAIKALPSAQQERKKGKWIYNSPVTMKCNQCGFVIKDWDWHRFKYCPNCIADMRGENDGCFNQQTISDRCDYVRAYGCTLSELVCGTA